MEASEITDLKDYIGVSSENSNLYFGKPLAPDMNDAVYSSRCVDASSAEEHRELGEKDPIRIDNLAVEGSVDPPVQYTSVPS